MSAEDTRIMLAHAFHGPGLPRAIFPELDQDALAEYLGLLAIADLDSLPRNVRRAFKGADKELLHDVLMRAYGRAFWAGAAFVVERDKT